MEGGLHILYFSNWICARLATDHYYTHIIMNEDIQFVESYNDFKKYPTKLIHDRNRQKSHKYKNEVDKHEHELFRTDSDVRKSYIYVPIRDYGDDPKGLAPFHFLSAFLTYL